MPAVGLPPGIRVQIEFPATDAQDRRSILAADPDPEFLSTRPQVPAEGNAVRRSPVTLALEDFRAGEIDRDLSQGFDLECCEGRYGVDFDEGAEQDYGLTG